MKKRSLLIADDVKSNILFLQDILKDDYNLKVTNNGQGVLKIASEENQPDLILLDVMMPEMDGFEACKRLKADANTAHIPVIFITALGEINDEDQGLALGAADYIVKPFNPVIVKRRIGIQMKILDLIDENTRLKEELSMR